MKKYILTLLFALLIFGCSTDDLLDKLPPYAADLDGAITNAKTAELALIGVYSNLPSEGYYSIYTTAPASFKAGTMRKPDWWTRGNAVYFYERYWPVLSGTSDYDWGYDYELIKNSNFLLNAIEGINDFEGNRKDEIIGELHFLRAVAYERLMLRYTQYWDINSELGLIIRNDLPGLDNVKKERSSVAESYQMIIDELDIAIDNCPDYSTCGQASKVAAQAYKTRVLFQMGNYSDCINMADEVLTHTENALAPDYATVFTDWSSTNEILFGRVFGASDIPDLESRITAFSSGKWGPSSNYITLLGNDPRYNAIIGDTVEVDYRYGLAGKVYKNPTVKKLVNSANDLPIIYMRTAEIYLLKAEAIYRNGGSYDDAYAPIAAIRSRAGADPVPHATQEEIETAICNEWLIEMSFENGHEYFALRRFGVEKLLERNDLLKEALDKAITKGSDAEAQYRKRIEDFRILPIPSSEINGNPVDQNPGY
ncbi:RagB/SusD family nutrient uptake outer membrane protein [Ancylomarina salipaludis]|uniref:RagB/SusD family nutrient uptake outer membrane protein n=1 Tax=Ancylomarina salipaludis TaxID=2501299 RepID=A0A4Q1JJQ7_9BACT|nr:RagB/SusD family nutrient uptake outer membrane protein [Ancylomarina salipaludis]RXQ91489.1 RagB/SusD family nutrient uptake outer membrane protein [Ancylomarina salipaludis]